MSNSISKCDSRLFRVSAEPVDLAADRDLLVEMIVPLALEAGDLGLEARLLDEALVARCDGLGETELIGLSAGVLDPPDRRIARHGHVDEARLALERLPAGRVDASLGRIGEELDLVVLVALAFDPAFALGDLGREPGHVEMVERDEPSVGVDPGAHGLGRADGNPLLAGVHVIEQALLGGRALVVLHEGDLGGGHAERDQLLPRPEIGGKAASLGDGRRAEVGEDHLRSAGDRVRRAVRAKIAAIGRLAPDFEDLGDHRIQFVLALVRMTGIDEPEVDCGVPAVRDDRKQDVVPLLGFALPLFDLFDALSQNPLVGLEGGARGNGDDLALAAGDPREPQILSKLRLQDDVGEVPEHRDELGDVDELGKPGDRLVEA